jgi:hypothetical protein
MLDTSVSDENRYPLKLADLIVMTVDPEVAPVKVSWASGPEQVVNSVPVVGLAGDRLHRPMFRSESFLPYQGIAMAIDPAGRGGDELAYAIVAMLNGTLYLLASGGLRNGYTDENLEALARLAKQFKARHIIVEENFGDGMFTKLLTPFLTRIYPCTTEEVKHSTQKEKRIIDTLEPVLNQHRLVVSEELLRKDQEADDQRFQLCYQMTRITKDRGALAKDDRLDVLAMAVAYWVEIMDKDDKDAEEDHRTTLLNAELARFHESVLGWAPPSDLWNPTLH